MNILYIHRTQGEGVEGVHIWGIIAGMKSAGHKVKVVSPQGIQEERIESNAKSRVKNEGSAFYHIISGYMPELIFEIAEVAYNLIARKAIRKLLVNYKPDVIYERYAIFATAGASVARKLGIPYILEVNYTSHSPLVRKRSAILMPLAKRIDKILFRNATLIVVVSGYLRDHIVEIYQVQPEKIIVCTNAADPDQFSDNTKAIKEVEGIRLDNKKIIGFVGSFAPWHGLDLLIEAFSRVTTRLPDTIVMLIGDGPEKSRIKQRIEDLQLQNKVVFAGNVDHTILPKYIAAFTIGVMPDSNEYGSPMKIFEYMALGKPVIVPDYGPLLESIEHGKQGMIFRKKDINSMAECILSLLGDDKALVKMSTQAREHIIKNHTWQENARISLSSALERYTERH